jgi:transcriptional regulator with XRE-family HTH domain
MPLDPDQQALLDFGNAAFGDEPWHGKLARITGVSRSYISQIVRGDKPVTHAVDSGIRHGVRQEISRMRAALVAYEKTMRESYRE